MRQLRLALAFLTRIPLAPSEPNAVPTPATAVWFPVAGALIGGAAGSVYWVSFQVMPAMPAAVLAIATAAVVTGGLHEDGLADTFDALGSGRDREAVLEIFKDSRIGTYGALALTLSILLKVMLLGTLDATAGLFVLVAAHAVGRAVAAGTMGFAVPAASGLGSTLMAGFSRAHAIAAGALGLAIAASLAGFPGVIGFAVAAFLGLLLVRWSTAKAGGVTGDVLGAVEQAGEIAVLAAVVVLVDQWSIPWWS